jgi:hypothetical protein
MKKWLVAFALVALCAVAAFAQTFDFTLVNKTGYPITEVNVSPADDNNWGEDVLGEDILPDGESFEVVFDKSYEAALLLFGVDKYDLKCSYKDGSSDEWYDLKLEDITYIVLSLDKKGNGVATYR